MRHCSRCNAEHTESEFHADKRSADGLAYWCKTSHKVYVKQLQKAKRAGGTPYSTKRFEG